jgi:hypothetical protein
MQEQQNEQIESRWQKIGMEGDVLAIDARKWAAIIDNETELMWAINPSKTADFPNTKKGLTWDEAIAWADRVNTQGWCGFNDWQLPDVFELKTLMTSNRQGKLYIDQSLFKDVNRSRRDYPVWSSTASSDFWAWLVSFGYGKEFAHQRHKSQVVRLVRYVQKDIPNRWQKIGLQGEELAIDDTQWTGVIDAKTKLMWAVNSSKKTEFPNPNKKLTWDETIAWISHVNTQGWCGYHNWRLPSIYELKTLLTKAKQPRFFIQEDIFNDIKEQMYLYCVWSSSSCDNWIGGVRFDNSNANYYLEYHHSAYIRLVRSI